MRLADNFQVTVTRENLLATLKSNRDKHAREYAEALEGYKQRCVKELRKRASAISRGKCGLSLSEFTEFRLPAPRNYTPAYDQIIAMLEAATDDEFLLDGDRFNAWMRDQWDWQKTHARTYALYSSEM